MTRMVAFLFLVCLCIGLIIACKPPPLVEAPVVSVEVKRQTARATFGADLLECVDNNDTDEAIDACADSVRRFWKRNGKDGGAK